MSRTDGSSPYGRIPDRGYVVVARRRGPRVSRLAWFAIVGVVVLIAGMTAVYVFGPLLDRAAAGEEAAPTATLDAHSAFVGPVAPEQDTTAVTGTTRLTVLGPQPLLDTRGSTPLLPGSGVDVPLPALPAGTTALLVEVSLQSAAGPGAVTVGSGEQLRPVLRAARDGAQTSATVTVPVPPDGGSLAVAAEGGGDVVLTLLGAYEPAQSSAAGRVVPVPATRVADLVPATDGNVATVALADVPVLQGANVGAVLLQLSADVGPNGGSVAAGTSPADLTQEVLWSATSGEEDRVRAGLLVVPAGDGDVVTLDYHAGRVLSVDVVGYVTSGAAPVSADGLVVPVTAPVEPTLVNVGAEGTAVVPIGPDGVTIPADRVSGVLVRVTGDGTAPDDLSVHSPADPPPAYPTVAGASAGGRSVLTLVGAERGTVQVTGGSDATVTLTPQAHIVSGP